MKRRGHIVDNITLDDIRREVTKVSSSNKIRRHRAMKFLEHFDEEAPAILKAIRTGTWKPRPLRVRDIFEHGKLRHIEIPSFEDMIVQRVLFYPRLEKLFVDHTWPHSYSSIKGRGPLKAAKCVARWIRSKRARWCLYFDAKKYYAHIDRATMKEDIRRMIKDRAALSLLDAIIDMGERGIAIGNTASHFLANLYLTPVVQQIATLSGVSHVVVYMDNVFVFGKSKRALHSARQASAQLLAARNLQMKEDWQVFNTRKRAVKIGGYRIRLGKPWRIYRATFKHLRRALRSFRRTPNNVQLARAIASLKGWITAAGCRHFYHSHIHPLWPAARKVIQHYAH